MRYMRHRALRVVVWCARKHRSHLWSPIAMILLFCMVVGSLVSHVDVLLIIGELLVALLDMGLQGYNALHHLKHRHRSLKRTHPTHWQALRRAHLWRDLRFKAPLALLILVIILMLLIGFHHT